MWSEICEFISLDGYDEDLEKEETKLSLKDRFAIWLLTLD